MADKLQSRNTILLKKKASYFVSNSLVVARSAEVLALPLVHAL